MSTMTALDTWLARSLPDLLADHGVPGAAVAVLADGEVLDHAAGVLNTATGVESTVDSVFQVGSITKVWTTTLAMQLVDEGLLDLDEPVRNHVPEFALADPDVAARITVRQLVCHTSGFEGDIFTDTGPGDDCVAKFVATLSDVPQLCPPGEMFSYNNAGYCVLGRVVEVLRGKSYDDCLRDHLVAPLGLTHTATGAQEAIRHRAAMGHLGRPPAPAPFWAMSRSNGPAGSMLAMRPRDLLTFTRMHLNDGRADDGTQVLSPGAARAMRDRQVDVPVRSLSGSAWGLGWALFDWRGGPVLGHDGGTIGQTAFLRVVPDRGVAVALLTNGGNPLDLYQHVVGRVLRDLADVEVPPLPQPAGALPADVSRFVGEYSSRVSDIVVSQDEDGRLWIERTPKGVLVEAGAAPERAELLGYQGDTLVARNSQLGVYLPHGFVGDNGAGQALFLHTSRADRRKELAGPG